MLFLATVLTMGFMFEVHCHSLLWHVSYTSRSEEIDYYTYKELKIDLL